MTQSLAYSTTEEAQHTWIWSLNNKHDFTVHQNHYASYF